jgi:hypothetical protein
MLRVVPDNLTQVAVSIETLLDMKNISVEEVPSMLYAVEQRRKPAVPHDNQGRLLLCEEEWMAKLKLRESKGKSREATRAMGMARNVARVVADVGTTIKTTLHPHHAKEKDRFWWWTGPKAGHVQALWQI